MQDRDEAGDEDATRAARRRRSALTLIAAFWAFAILMLTVRATLIDTAPLAVMMPRRLVTAAVGTALCLAMARVLRALGSRGFPERIAWGVAGAFVMAVVETGITTSLNRIILPVPELGPFDLSDSAQWVLVWFGYFLAWTGTHLALTYHWEVEDHQRRAGQLARATREAQMAALRYQLSPHFLFNTLNSISSLVGDRHNDQAETMLLNLATFVRATLTDAPAGTILLHQEIELQRLYLAIEQARFGERLKVVIDVPDRLARLAVPALILQPLVENAIHHGVSRSEVPLTIRITAAERGEGLVLTVEDDGNAAKVKRHDGPGVGLANVRERLRTHFDDAASLVAAPAPQGGFRVELVLPGQAA